MNRKNKEKYCLRIIHTYVQTMDVYISVVYNVPF